MRQKISPSFWFVSFFLLIGFFALWGNFFQKSAATGTVNKVAFQAEKRFPAVTVPKNVSSPETVVSKGAPSAQTAKPTSIRQTKTS